MATVIDAEKAIQEFDKFQINTSTLRVRVAMTPEEKQRQARERMVIDSILFSLLFIMSARMACRIISNLTSLLVDISGLLPSLLLKCLYLVYFLFGES